jgi:cobalamin biosynthesis Mg chelatase CobN
MDSLCQLCLSNEKSPAGIHTGQAFFKNFKGILLRLATNSMAMSAAKTTATTTATTAATTAAVMTTAASATSTTATTAATATTATASSAKTYTEETETETAAETNAQSSGIICILILRILRCTTADMEITSI